MSEPLFLQGGDGARTRIRYVAAVLAAVERWAGMPGPRSSISAEALARMVRSIEVCPEEGVDFADVIDQVGTSVLAHGVRTFDPACVAHLHCPTLASAAAAELAIGATNQSLDSYDQAPAATLVEDHLVGWLADLVGLRGGSGVLTGGGTASNLLGLFLARSHTAPTVGADGLPAEATSWRIVTSEAAHFSVRRAAAVLGLGRAAVVPVPTDRFGRMDVAGLDVVLDRLDADGLRAVALVGTAGTTDLGAIDPLEALADRAAARGIWFQVDAAVGGAFCLSERLRPRLAGLDRADSVTVDLHKLWWQPIGASALLVRDPAAFGPVREPSDYLDRDEDEVLNLVSRSLDTSRRFDALKVLVSLRATGRRRLAEMLEHLVATAAATAEHVAAHPELELLAPASTVMVVFRWNPGGRPDAELDAANTRIQQELFATGQAVVGRTRIAGQVALKLTLVNPLITVEDTRRLLDRIVLAAGPDHRVGASAPATPGPQPPVEVSL